MPASTSFPSGHAASGFAFAAAIGRDQPWLGLTLRFLAAAARRSSRSGRGKRRELPDGADAEGAMIPVPAPETG